MRLLLKVGIGVHICMLGDGKGKEGEQKNVCLV